MRLINRLYLGSFIILLAGCPPQTSPSQGMSPQNPDGTMNQLGAEANTEDCPNGGIMIESGKDQDGNAHLTSEEITKRYALCRPARPGKGPQDTAGRVAKRR
mgnify:CR=1 FL=1